jgi:LPS sulfotransferase NodH
MEHAIDSVIAGLKPETSYVICASARSGSNLLCEALWNTELAGHPDEYFLYWHWAAHEPARLSSDFVQPWLLPTDAFLQKLARAGTTPNGVFGVKIMWEHLEVIIDNLRALRPFRDLEATAIFPALWPNLHYIQMIRRDKVRQAVSLARAIQSRQWFDVDQQVLEQHATYFKNRNIERLNAQLRSGDDTPLTYDFDQIHALHRAVVEQEQEWNTFLCDSDLKIFRVVYEDFVQAYTQTIRDIMDFLQTPMPETMLPERRFMRKQSDALNDEWSQQFRHDLAIREEYVLSE